VAIEEPTSGGFVGEVIRKGLGETLKFYAAEKVGTDPVPEVGAVIDRIEGRPAHSMEESIEDHQYEFVLGGRYLVERSSRAADARRQFPNADTREAFGKHKTLEGVEYFSMSWSEPLLSALTQQWSRHRGTRGLTVERYRHVYNGTAVRSGS
jgi:hypothetical protein